MYHTGTAQFEQHSPSLFNHTPLPANKVMHCILAPSCSCCREAVNVVPVSGSERALEVHFLHLIRVDYSVPQPCSRQSHTKGGPAPVCTGALWSEGGAGYLSTPTDQSLPANRLTPSPSTFHSSALVWKGMCGVWPCECVCVCSCGEVVCGGEPLFALEPWWPLRSPSHSDGCSRTPLSLNHSATFSPPLPPS